jgi:hypothetical protein
MREQCQLVQTRTFVPAGANACLVRFMSASKVLGEETVKGSAESPKAGEQDK